MLKNISAIIFDLGGVVIDLDVDKSLALFSQYTGLSNKEIYNKFLEDGWTFAFEKGEITAAEFRNRVRLSLGQSISDRKIDDSWNAMIRELPLERLELLGNLQDRFKTIVLSNTNDIHIELFDSVVADVTGGSTIDQYFHKIYYSHKVGMRKPDAEIYEYVVNNNDLDPSSTLFIDDMKANIEGAQTVGLQTLHLTDQNYLFELFA
ncbi:MAG: HAD family phosphatase [Bacteroidota bacterium]